MRTLMPPLLHSGRIPHFSNGGPVFSLCTHPHRSEAAEFLRQHTHADANGACVLTQRPAPGDAFVLEGRARRGETFGFAAWPSGTVAVWRPVRGHAILSPLLVHIGPVDLGQQGAWTIAWDTQDAPHPRLSPPWRSVWGLSSRIDGPTAPLFAPCAQNPDSGAQRAAGIVESGILQALSDHIHASKPHPLVVGDDTARLRKSWTRPSWSQGHDIGEHARNTRLRAIVLPLVARAILHRDLTCPVRITADSATRSPNGALCAPTFTLSTDDFGCASGGIPPTLRTALNLRATQAWEAGQLGPAFDWFLPHSHNLANIHLDPATMSKHALLAALAKRPHLATGKTGP